MAWIVKQGNDITLLAIGPIVNSAIDAATMLAKEGLDCAVVNARFAKPLDSELILNQAARTGNYNNRKMHYVWFCSSVLELVSLHPEWQC